MKISVIKELAIGIGLDQISGKVTKAYAQKSGTGEFGDWTLQGIELTDDTGSINCQIKNHPPIEKGIDITIKGHINSKKELKGITLGEYKGEKQVSVTKSATIGGLIQNPTSTPETPKTAHSVPNSPTVVKPPDWDLKDLRIIRQCAWKVVAQLYSGKPLPGWAEMEILAHDIEADIYREVKKSEIPFGEDK